MDEKKEFNRVLQMFKYINKYSMKFIYKMQKIGADQLKCDVFR